MEKNKAKFSEKIPFILSLLLGSVNKDIIEKIYLFGSYSNNNANENSDIDIYVIINDNVFNRLEEATKMQLALSNNNIIPCDLIVNKKKIFEEGKKRSPKGFEVKIEEKGIVLYEK